MPEPSDLTEWRPKRPGLSLLAKGLARFNDYLQNDPVDVLPLGLTKPVAKGFAGLLGLEPASKLLDKLAYGDNLTRGKGQTFSAAPAVFDGTLALAPPVAGLLKGMGKVAGKIPTQLPSAPNAITWHGSPHTFEKFDSSKIGTGEGAQAYGHGLYLAESKDVAKQYFDELNPSLDIARGGVDYDGIAQRLLSAVDGNRQRAIDELILRRDAPHVKGDQEWADKMNKAIQYLQGDAKSSSLYKVDLPDEQIAKMLDWDKTLAAQPEIKRKLFDNGLHRGLYRISGGRPLGEFTGGNLMRSRTDSHRTLMSDDLNKLGIPGVRYLDGMARQQGQGTSNFVIFPGNESFLTILERNGVPLNTGLARGR